MGPRTVAMYLSFMVPATPYIKATTCEISRMTRNDREQGSGKCAGRDGRVCP